MSINRFAFFEVTEYTGYMKKFLVAIFLIVVAVVVAYVLRAPATNTEIIQETEETTEIDSVVDELEGIVVLADEDEIIDIFAFSDYVNITGDNAWPLDILETPGEFTCEVGETGTPDAPITTTLEEINGREYCATTIYTGAAMGKVGYGYTFTTKTETGVARVDFELVYNNCTHGYDPDSPQVIACQEAEAAFDLNAIIASVFE